MAGAVAPGRDKAQADAAVVELLLVIPDRGESQANGVQLSLLAPRQEPTTTSQLSKSIGPSTSNDTSAHRTPKLQRIASARLLKRIGYEMETCPRCGAVMRVVECVLAAEAIGTILAARGGHSHSSSRTGPPARAPPQLSFGFASSAPAKTA